MPAPKRPRRHRPEWLRPQSDGAATEAVMRTLWAFRKEHGWEPGQVWDPRQGAYVAPADQTYWPAP